MTVVRDTGRYRQILHKRHGWLYAGGDGWFEQSKSGKTWELHDTLPASTVTRYHYPFGTTFHDRSIIALSDELEEEGT